MEKIYFDAATTPTDSEVAKVTLEYMAREYGNPNSAHSFGRVACKAVEEARESVAAFPVAENMSCAISKNAIIGFSNAMRFLPQLLRITKKIIGPAKSGPSENFAIKALDAIARNEAIIVISERAKLFGGLSDYIEHGASQARLPPYLADN